jgi:hypothetical protein
VLYLTASPNRFGKTSGRVDPCVFISVRLEESQRVEQEV